jgi:hypothetical protein
MNKTVLLLLMAVLLCGCGVAGTFETVGDEMIQEVAVQPKEIRVDVPEDSVMPAMESENGRIYLCEDYDVAAQIFPAGDLEATVRTVSGYGTEDLTIIQTASGELDRYEFVWTAAGEMGQNIGRATVLDDGNYHYVLSATIKAELIGEYQEVWNGIFESFHLG